MASFRLKFESSLKRRGVDVIHDPAQPADAVLLIAGSRHLGSLWKAKRGGTRIVQRLDGLNWVQRARWSGFRYHLRGEYGNLLLVFLRNRIADRVIYQSEFVRQWWQDWYGKSKVPERVVLNGVDLDFYSPDGPAADLPQNGRYRMLIIEGSLAGGLNTGLFHAVSLAKELAPRFPMEIVVAGVVDRRTRDRITGEAQVPVNFLGVVPRERIPEWARSAHIFYSAEVNPPCPNSVIEALACGLPVVGFDTGSLKELVVGDAGRLAPYGGDPWKLDSPDVQPLAHAAAEILDEPARFKKAARLQAQAALGLERMVDDYLRILLE